MRDYIAGLVGSWLDYWMAVTECYEPRRVPVAGGAELRCQVLIPAGWVDYDANQNPMIAMPVMQRRRYTVYPRAIDPITCQRYEWMAEAQENPQFHEMMIGSTPMEAICRLRVLEAHSIGQITVKGEDIRDVNRSE